jgi:acyl transferase domain-containing protein/aryl carrier-like protein
MESIAIIGIGCRFADAANPRAFFDLLKSGTDATTDVPKDRWNLRSFYDPDRRAPGKLSALRGGFLTQIDGFDAHFFGISPREAACMDPQQRLLLEVSWEAMEDAGLVPERLAGADVGVFVGGFTLDYKAIQLGYLNRHLMDTHTATGAMMTMLSNRLSHTFDFRGPSMSVDTACSSSLVAVHLACGSIRNGECSMALAGGVNVMVTPEYTIAESKGGFLAPDGRSKPFSAAANGYGRAEGAGVVVLKSLTAAIADGDPIYAVIRGSAVNQDGHTNGITVPSSEAQIELIREACSRAGVEPGRIQYVEAHGTGTSVGDPIEISALAAALGTGRAKDDRCIVGSVKGNIGHMEAAAGVAGLIKAAMCIKHRQIPPNLHFDEPNPKIPFDQLPLRVPTALESWPAADGPALAGVNSFGFGGTNAHVVIEQAPCTEESRTVSDDAGPAVVFPISARSPEALDARARDLRDFARAAATNGISFADMYYSAAQRRSHYDHRLGIVAGSSAELADLLDAHLNGEPRSAVAAGVVPLADPPKLVFVCTGMGPQWWGMGRQLFADEPVFREAILECNELFHQEANWQLLPELMANEAHSRMTDTAVAQPSNFAVQVALAALWKSWGIEPQAIVGHSVGEVSAAYLSGALSLRQAIRVSFHRSRLQQTTAGSGAMIAAGLPAEALIDLVEPYEGRISIAAVNSPTSTTLAGDPAAIEDLARSLTAKQIFNRPLRVNIAYHSAQMDRVKSELLESLASLEPRSVTVPLYSTVAGARVVGRELDAAYWWRNVREPVQFRAAMEGLIHDGFDCFLEVGPHPVLASSIGECLADLGKKGARFCSLRRAEDESAGMRNSLASLYAAGFPVAWEKFQSAGARFVRLPAYPWQRERHWSESEQSIADRIGVEPHPLLGRRVASARPTWELEVNTRLLEYLPDHAVRNAVVLPGAAYVEMALAAGREVLGATGAAVERIRFERALFLTEGDRPVVQIALDPEEGTFEIHSRSGSGAWARNAAGRLTQDCGAEPARLDAASIQERCPTAMDKEDCYRQFAAQGFHYGPAFQRIDSMRTGSGEAIACFDNVDAGDAAYQLHPAVLDACFQVLVATDPFGSAGGTSDKTYLPVGIKRIRIRKRPEGSMWAWAHLTRTDAAGATGTICLCDGDGAVAIEIEDFEVKALDTAEGALSREQMDRNLYDVAWIAAPRDTESEIAPPGCWLVFADATGAADSAAERFREAAPAVVFVKPGDRYEFRPRRRSCTLNPAVPEHFTRLLEDVEKNVALPLTAIAHLWNLDLGAEPQSPVDLDRAETLGCLSVLHLVKAIVQRGSSPRLWIVTRGAQAAGSHDSIAVMQSAVWGLGRVIGHQEHIGMWGGLVDLDPESPAGEMDAVIQEMRQPTDEDQLAFRSGERYAARLDRCADLTPPAPVRLRADASYVVTGAFGALGQLTARWMVERGARRLILMGRSALPDRVQWDAGGLRPDVARRVAAIRELESMGATVVVAPVDVADESELRDFLSQYEREGWPAIRGVIHSAGLVRDQFMVQMDAPSFSDVLRPKVRGAWNLHCLLAGAPLDFFVLYSSIGSLVAAMGQANYASGNAFLDALAHHRKRQGLPALSINWGPWAVGMVKDLNLTDHYASRGLDVITPEQGMRYLARLMGQPSAQAAVLSADWRKMTESQPKVSAMVAHLAAASASGGDGAAESSQEEFLHELLMAEPGRQSCLMEEHLQGLAARVLRMDREKVDVSHPLSALGLDSMMAMELKNRIELSLHAPVSVLDLLSGLSLAELSQLLLSRAVAENAELHRAVNEIASLPETIAEGPTHAPLLPEANSNAGVRS